MAIMNKKAFTTATKKLNTSLVNAHTVATELAINAIEYALMQGRGGGEVGFQNDCSQIAELKVVFDTNATWAKAFGRMLAIVGVTVSTKQDKTCKVSLANVDDNFDARMGRLSLVVGTTLKSWAKDETVQKGFDLAKAKGMAAGYMKILFAAGMTAEQIQDLVNDAINDDKGIEDAKKSIAKKSPAIAA